MPISETSLLHVKSTKDQYSGHIKKCYRAVGKRQHNRKMSKRSDTSFQRRKVQMVNEHTKRQTTSLVIRKGQIKLMVGV